MAHLFLQNLCFSSDEHCVTQSSAYCMLTFWLSCFNYALRGEFPLLHSLLQDIFTYALFWLPRVNLSLKHLLPYYTNSFSWNKRLLEPKFLCNEWSVNLNIYIFFAKVTTLFLKWKLTHFPLIKFIGIGANPAQKLYIVVHWKEQLKKLHSHWNLES